MDHALHCTALHCTALRIENKIGSDPHSYEATEAVVQEVQKQFWGFNWIQTHDLCDTGAMLYQLSYEASLGVGRAESEFNLYPL